MCFKSLVQYNKVVDRALPSRLCAQDSVTDVSNPFSRYRTQWGEKSKGNGWNGRRWDLYPILSRKLLTPQQVWFAR